MKKKFLVVKGNKFQAARAAASRGVPFVFEREIGYNQTTGYTTASEYDLNQWFVESIKPPYPVGALLFWTYAKD